MKKRKRIKFKIYIKNDKLKKSKKKKKFANKFEWNFPFVFSHKIRIKKAKEKLTLSAYLGRYFPVIKIIWNLSWLLLSFILIFIRFKVINLVSIGVLTLFSILSIKPLLQWIYALKKVKEYKIKGIEELKRQHIQMRDGTPGAGKTSSGLNDTLLLAENNYEELKFKVFLYKNQYKKILKSKDESTIKDMLDSFESFNFWASHQDLIPCFMSNIPVLNKGRKALEIDILYLFQFKKIPYLTAVFYDELGTELECISANKKEKYERASLLFRYIRHYINGYIISSEQDNKNVNIMYRRPCGLNRKMIEQKPFLKSKFVKRIVDRIKKVCIKKYIEKNKPFTNKWIINLYLFIFNFYLNNGFRVFTYIDRGNSEYDENINLVTNKNKRKTFYTYSNLGFKYDDRSNKNGYEADEYEIVYKVYNQLILDKKEIYERRTHLKLVTNI